MRAVGIDVGGTFTDFVLFESGSREVHILKLSSGRDPVSTVIEGITELCRRVEIEPSEIDLLIHGTTVATNAVLQHQGAKTGLITTQGFRDVVHIGRHQRPQNYSIQQDIPWQARPIVKRRYRLPVRERLIPPDGDVLVPLEKDDVRRAAEQLAQEGVEAVAVCFLFSYLNNAHEAEAAEIIRKIIPDAYVCMSSDVVPQFREFERFTTTAMNAFIGARVGSYVGKLQEQLEELGVRSTLHIMQSNGGSTTPEIACRRPVTLLLSGPVGGVIGGVWSAQRDGSASDRSYLVTLDVGGTSADIAVIVEEGLVEARPRDTWIAGYPVMVPMVDIESIGAGGGSIAYVDEAGALHVGPGSAGAVPGPASYGTGGVEPTLTDANVILGRLPRTLAGQFDLDRALATRAIQRIAGALAVSEVEAAMGIVRIVNENMAAAIRMKTIQRGLDPRDFRLVAFGGAGPVQAAELARILEISEVLIPSRPGVTSAAGLLTSDLRHDVIVSYLRLLIDVDPGELTHRFRKWEEDLRSQLADEYSDSIQIEWAADLRYQGQSYELKVPIKVREFTTARLAELRSAFDQSHQLEFGHHFPDLGVELVNLRLVGIRGLPHLDHTPVSGKSLSEAHVDDIDVYFAGSGGVDRVKTPVYERELMPSDRELVGPAIIVQFDSTTLVPPCATLRRDPLGNLLMAV